MRGGGGIVNALNLGVYRGVCVKDACDASIRVINSRVKAINDLVRTGRYW